MRKGKRPSLPYAGPARIIIFTGAGTSAEAGIPTFRYNLDGRPAFWNEVDPLAVCDITTFRQNRADSCDFHNKFRTLVGQSQPTSFHHAVKTWQQECTEKGMELIVITQNVDDLFERAGVDNIVHVHGEIRYMQCLAYKHQWFVGYDHQMIDTACKLGCGCKVCKPGVVFFNERAPAYEATLKLLESLGTKDTLIVLGTSCKVFPLETVLENGRVRKIYSGLDFPASLSPDLFDRVILGPCTEVLGRVEWQRKIRLMQIEGPDLAPYVQVAHKLNK